MNKVKSDLKKNRIYITLTKASRTEMEEIVNKIEKECRKLQTGFTCMTDIRNFTPLKDEDQEFMISAQAILWQAGMGRVVRIRSESRAGEIQLEKASLSTGYTAATVTNINDAEKILDHVL